MNIDFIHGDHLVNPTVPLLISSDSTLSFREILQQYPQAERLKLTTLAEQSVYQFSVNGQAQLISAHTGKSLLPFSKVDIKKLVTAHTKLSSDINISEIRLLTKNAPSELSVRHLPVWQIVYDDISAATIYISPSTGQVVTKRHNFWRIFDFMWMLHIMDYENREDITNWLLFTFSLTGIFSCFSGLYLVGHRFRFAAKLSRIFFEKKNNSSNKVNPVVKGVLNGDGKSL